MNVKTGAILAVSNYPSFDPNKRDLTNYNDTFLNEAFECGSVFQTICLCECINRWCIRFR